MRLEMHTFKVEDVVASDRTAWRDGVLEVDLTALSPLVLEDPRVAAADVFIAKPGERVRILPVHDVIEPRMKVGGAARTYPGLARRPRAVVGDGRTHRLAGVGVLECALVPGVAGDPSTVSQASYFLDMSGPAALQPHAGLFLVCARVTPVEGIDETEQADAAWTATLRVSDALCEATRAETASVVRVYELDMSASEAPRVVCIVSVRSPEHFGASPYAFGTSIYGVTRLAPPWLLHPNEVLDGAIARSTVSTSTWLQVNNPVIADLYDAHPDRVRFAGVIVQRTRWTGEDEKTLTASQSAKIASMLGASGAIVLCDAGGNDFIEIARTVEECEARGIKTVFVLPDEVRSVGTTVTEVPWRAHAAGQTQVVYQPERADAVISTGGRLYPFIPPPERIVGFDQDVDGIPAREVMFGGKARPIYGQFDYFGWNSESGFDH